MSALVHRIETPSTRDVWATEGPGQTAHLVLAAQLLTEYECPKHGVWSMVRDEPPDDSPWALGAQRVVWRDDDRA